MQVYISQEHSCRLPKPSAGFVRVLAGTCQASTVPLHPMQIRAVAFCYGCFWIDDFPQAPRQDGRQRTVKPRTKVGKQFKQRKQSCALQVISFDATIRHHIRGGGQLIEKRNLSANFAHSNLPCRLLRRDLHRRRALQKYENSVSAAIALDDALSGLELLAHSLVRDQRPIIRGQIYKAKLRPRQNRQIWSSLQHVRWLKFHESWEQGRERLAEKPVCWNRLHQQSHTPTPPLLPRAMTIRIFLYSEFVGRAPQSLTHTRGRRSLVCDADIL